MSQKTKLKKILGALTPDETKVDFALFDQEIAKLKASLKEKVQLQTLDDVKAELEKFQRRIDFEPLVQALNQREQGINEQIRELSSKVDSKISEFKVMVSGNERASKEDVSRITTEIANLRDQITKLNDEKNGDIKELKDNLNELIIFGDRLEQNLKTVGKDIKDIKSGSTLESESTNKKFDAVTKIIEDNYSQLRERINTIANRGGGSPNQQINVNSSVMSTRYADINFVSDTAISWSATNDDTNKRVNLRASLISGGASGPGGSPAGNNTEIQYNDNGSFGASSGLTWNKNTSVLSTNEGIVEGHAFRGDASDGGFLQTNNGLDIVSFGSANTANVTFYGNVNMSSLLSVTSTLSGSGAVFSGDTQARGTVLNGATSGSVRIIPASVAGNWLFTLPPNDGNANFVLTTDGNGVTTWASVAATGGSGITRTTSIITADTVGGTTGSTDYVYIATGGMSFTLPDASGNTNLYTLKNASNSSVLVTAVGGDTIDGSGSVLVAINNQSLDFISDSANWRII